MVVPSVPANSPGPAGCSGSVRVVPSGWVISAHTDGSSATGRPDWVRVAPTVTAVPGRRRGRRLAGLRGDHGERPLVLERPPRRDRPLVPYPPAAQDRQVGAVLVVAVRLVPGPTDGEQRMPRAALVESPV